MRLGRVVTILGQADEDRAQRFLAGCSLLKPHGAPGRCLERMCIFSQDKGLAVVVECDRLLIRRGKIQVEVFPGEIRHLVTALGSLHHDYQWQADEGASYTRAI